MIAGHGTSHPCHADFLDAAIMEVSRWKGHSGEVKKLSNAMVSYASQTPTFREDLLADHNESHHPVNLA